MTLKDLIALSRDLLADWEDPQKISDGFLIRALNEAEREASIRAKLLYDESLSPIVTVANTQSYALDPSIFEIERRRVWWMDGDNERHVEVTSRDWLDGRRHRDWHTSNWHTETGEPRYLIVDTGLATVVPIPDDVYTLYYGAYRTPLTELALPDDVPEIEASHHADLVDWVLYRAYSVTDNEVEDRTRAQLHDAAFTAHFGARKDANVLRKRREKKIPLVRLSW